MRVVFAGSPAVAVHYLSGLVHAGFTMEAVVTREDAPVGRRRVLAETPVSIEASRLGLPVIKSNSLRDQAIPECDIAVVVAYGGRVPRGLLSRPRLGWINVHFSRLPAYRGAAPVQRALWNGDRESGVTIFRLVEELDAGPVLFSRTIAFRDDETAGDALERFAIETVDDLIATIRLLDSGALVSRPQTSDVSFAPKFLRTDGRIDWSLDAATVVNRIRAVTPEPGAFTTLAGNPVGVVRARRTQGDSLGPGVVDLVNASVVVGTGDGVVELVELSPAGKRPMSALDWWRGIRQSVRFE